MRNLDKYKYKTSFSSEVQTITLESQKNIAQASLDSLKAILPNGLNIQDNPDLLYIVANGAVANLSNKNQDCVCGSDIVKISPLAINKYITIEHKRNNGAVGSILGSGFSKYGSNEIISPEEAAQLTTPFNWAISAYIWEVLNPGLVNYLLECSEETSKNSFAASLSWELFFSDYQLLVGSDNVSEGNIITDANQITELSKYLKANGGEGIIKETKEPIHRLIIGDMLPGGFSITNSPAASVKGILPITSYTPVTLDDDKSLDMVDQALDKLEKNREEITISSMDVIDNDEEKEVSMAKNAENNNNLIKKSENITVQEKNSVNNNTNLKITKKNIYMKFKSRKDITADKFVSLSNDQAVFVNEELNEFMDQFAVDLDNKKQEIVAKESEIKELKASADKAVKEVEEIRSKLADVEKVRASEKEANDLTNRIGDLTKRFELSEKGVQAIANQIKGLPEDKYKAWLEFAESTFAAKKAPAKKAPDSDGDDDADEPDDADDKKEAADKKKAAAKSKEAKASIEDDYDFETVKEKDSQRILNNTLKDRNLIDDVKAAFAGWEKELSVE